MLQFLRTGVVLIVLIVPVRARACIPNGKRNLLQELVPLQIASHAAMTTLVHEPPNAAWL